MTMMRRTTARTRRPLGIRRTRVRTLRRIRRLPTDLQRYIGDYIPTARIRVRRGALRIRGHRRRFGF